MAPGADGHVRIDTKLDSGGFNSGIKRMISSLGTLAAVVGIAFGVGAIINFGKTAVDAASQMANALTGLQSIMNGQGKSFADAQKFIDDYTKDGLIPATNAITAYKSLASAGFSNDDAEQVLLRLKDASAFGRASYLSMGEAVQSASEGIKNQNSILVDNSGVTKNLSIMWEEYARSIGKTAATLTQAERNSATLNGIIEETKFQVGDAAKAAGTYSGKVAALSASFLNMRIALGNVIIPILAAIIPYIRLVIDWLTALFSTFAQISAALFGVQQTTQAAAAGTEAAAGGLGDAADGAGDLANNTKKAGKAAKGALAAFDELNVLAMDDKAGTGAGDVTTPPVTVPVIPEVPATVVSPEVLAAVEAFKARLIELFTPAAEAFGRFRESLEGLGGTIWNGLKWAWDNILVPLGEWVITDVLPVFLDLLAVVLDVLNNVLLALQPLGLWLFENFLKPLAEWTGGAIVDILQWLVDRLRDLSTWITENQGAVEVIVIAITAFALAWWLVNAAIAAWAIIGGIGTAITTAFGVAVAFLTSPIFLVALAIAALIVIVILLIKNWDLVKETAGKVWDWIKQKWAEAGAWFKRVVTDPVVAWFKQAWADVKTAAQNAWQALVNAWTGAKAWVKEKVTDPIKNAFETALDWVGEKWETVFTGIQSFVKNTINGIIDLINGMIGAVAGGINAIVDGINSISVSVPDWVPVYGGQSWGFSLPSMPVPQIPRLATGAVIPANSEFLAILGDQRQGANVEAPASLIRQIVGEELDARRSDEKITVEFQGSMGALVRAMKPHIKREDRRTGGSLIKGVTTA